MRKILCLFLAFNALRCGVEAGNAGGVKSKSGNIQILFAQQQVSGGESLSVQLGTLGLIGSEGSELATLNPSVGTVDLYGASSANLLVAESTSVAPGSYAKLKIRLAGDRPVRYKDSGGSERAVNLDEDAKESFYFLQEITVAENETTIIVVNLDPFKSLAKSEGSDAYTFRPRGDATSHDRDIGYKGATAVTNANWVCAYAYAIQEPGEPRRINLSRSSADYQPLPMPPQVKERPSFATRTDIIFDDTSTCENAFARVPVMDGAFLFGHLLPGRYALRFFTRAGVFVDGMDDVVVPTNLRP